VGRMLDGRDARALDGLNLDTVRSCQEGFAD
jgi:hypothetical protein